MLSFRSIPNPHLFIFIGNVYRSSFSMSFFPIISISFSSTAIDCNPPNMDGYLMFRVNSFEDGMKCSSKLWRGKCFLLPKQFNKKIARNSVKHFGKLEFKVTWKQKIKQSQYICCARGRNGNVKKSMQQKKIWYNRN